MIKWLNAMPQSNKSPTFFLSCLVYVQLHSDHGCIPFQFGLREFSQNITKSNKMAELEAVSYCAAVGITGVSDVNCMIG